MTVRIAVLASGGGSNLQAIIDHFAVLGEAASGQITLVASNRASAKALERAETAGIATHHIYDPADGDALLDAFEQHEIGMVVLAGYLKLIPAVVTERFRGRMINVHPGPLPRFGGPGMYGARVHAAVIDAGADASGVTIHFVDDRYDHGAVIAHWPVPVHPDDTPDALAARVLAAEHVAYPRAIDTLAAMLAATSRS